MLFRSESILNALEDAAPTQVIGGFARRFRYIIAGTDRHGRSYIWHFFSNRGGAGANKREDGWNNLGSIHNPGGTPAPSVERTESSFPLFVEEFSLATDSGGAGARRGGVGGRYTVRYEGEGPAVVNTTGEGVIIPPYGLGGARPGRPHDYRLFHRGREVKLGTKDIDVVIEPGDRIVANSAGGGGYGDPHGRDRALVNRDVAYGYVSAEAAKRIYGLED